MHADTVSSPDTTHVVNIDARHWPLPPERKLAGLPLFLRTLLTLERAGATHLKIYGGDAQRLQAVLERRRPSIPVEFFPSEEPPADAIPACSLVDAANLQQAWTQGKGIEDCAAFLADETAFRQAERRLWSALRKPIENDGVIAYFLGRPISRLVSRLLIDTPVSPNAVTVASFAVALAGALLLPHSLAAGATLYWFSFVLDCVDGELARLRFQGSRLGQWLDTIADDAATVAFSTGLSFTLLTLWPAAAIAGFAAAAAYALFCIPIYRQLARMPVVDTAQYPYFFMGERGAASTNKNFWVWVAYLFRRDVILFAHMLLSFFSLLKAMFVLQFVINTFMALITMLDVIVKAFRPHEN